MHLHDRLRLNREPRRHHRGRHACSARRCIDYKLVDVPELGYFRTDKPHPRGELLVKTDSSDARLLQAARR